MTRKVRLSEILKRRGVNGTLDMLLATEMAMQDRMQNMKSSGGRIEGRVRLMPMRSMIK